MSVRSSQSVTVCFYTHNPDTSALKDADSTPIGTLIVSGTNNAASVTVTNRGTGDYKAAVTLPSLSFGDIVELKMAATVSGPTTTVTSADIVWRDTCDLSLTSGGLVAISAASVQTLAQLRGYKTIYFVRKDGNDSNAGTSPAAAKLTLAAAQTLASSGDLIIVAPGTYAESGLGKDRVDWDFADGVIVSDTTMPVADRYIFGDSGSAKTYSIFGRGEFINSTTEETGFELKVINQSNASSVFNVKCKRIFCDNRFATSDTGNAVQSIGRLMTEADRIEAWGDGLNCIGGYQFTKVDYLQAADHAVGGGAGVQVVKARYIDGTCNCIPGCIQTIEAEQITSQSFTVRFDGGTQCIKAQLITHETGDIGVAGATVWMIGTGECVIDCDLLQSTIDSQVIRMISGGTGTLTVKNANIVAKKTTGVGVKFDSGSVLKLRLHNASVKSGATATESVAASDAQTLYIAGTVNFDKAVNANVTLSSEVPAGPLHPQVTGRTLSVDTSHKAASTIAVGDIATDAINASALATDAIAEIAAKIALDHGSGSYVDTGAGGDATLANQTTILTNIAAVKTDTGALVTRITSTLFSGITYLSKWLGALAGKTADTSTRAEINATPAGATFNETTDSQEATRDRGDVAWLTGESTGTGARSVTVTVTDGTDELEGATVRFTQGVNGFVAASSVLGLATFSLDDGTYTLSITKAGYTYTPSSQVVDGTETITAVMTANIVSPPSDPGLSVGVLTTYDASGAAASGQHVHFRLKTGDASDGRSYPRSVFTEESDTDGLIEAEFVIGFIYEGSRDGGTWTSFTVPDDPSFELPEILGKLGTI